MKIHNQHSHRFRNAIRNEFVKIKKNFTDQVKKSVDKHGHKILEDIKVGAEDLLKGTL